MQIKKRILEKNIILGFFALFSLAIPNTASGSNLPVAIDTALDLETMAQDFVIEVKQIQIPGHPNACNPSLIRWNRQLLLSFDAYIDRNDQPDGIGLTYLDEDFNVVDEPQILDLPRNLWQDPRLITVAEHLYLVFNGAITQGIRRMFVGEVVCNDGKFTIDSVEPLLSFHRENAGQWERNWIPFVYNNTLYLTYSLMPHRVLQPILGTQRCEEVASTLCSTTWNWGMPKPGTAAYHNGDHYLALFHSVKVIATTHSEGTLIQHYFMGAYTFEKDPPFAITAISRDPIVSGNFYHGKEYEMIKPCRVVFPCGITMDDQFVWVVFGRQDHEVWMAKLEKKGLYENLVPVTPNGSF